MAEQKKTVSQLKAEYEKQAEAVQALLERHDAKRQELERTLLAEMGKVRDLKRAAFKAWQDAQQEPAPVAVVAKE